MYYEIRKVKPWHFSDSAGDYWELDHGEHIRFYKTEAKDKKRAFCYALHMDGFRFERGKNVVVDDVDACGFLVLKERKTGKPLFVAWELSERDLQQLPGIEWMSRPGAVY